MKKFSLLLFFLSLTAFGGNKFLFIHGGPGSNSAPERVMLKEAFEKKLKGEIYFWDEPSFFRGERGVVDFVRVTGSIAEKVQEVSKGDEKVNIIAHSFGARLVLESLGKIKDSVDRFIFLNPVFELNSSDKKFIKISLSDFKKNDEKKFKELKGLMRKMSKTSFDKKKEDAFLLSFQSAKLIPSFWENFEVGLKYYGHQTGGYKFDLDNFKSIRRSTPYSLKNIEKVVHDTLLVFGNKDPIVSLSTQKKHGLRIFKTSRVRVIEGKHFLHIEKMYNLLNLLDEFLNQ